MLFQRALGKLLLLSPSVIAGMRFSVLPVTSRDGSHLSPKSFPLAILALSHLGLGWLTGGRRSVAGLAFGWLRLMEWELLTLRQDDSASGENVFIRVLMEDGNRSSRKAVPLPGCLEPRSSSPMIPLAAGARRAMAGRFSF